MTMPRVLGIPMERAQMTTAHALASTAALPGRLGSCALRGPRLPSKRPHGSWLSSRWARQRCGPGSCPHWLRLRLEPSLASCTRLAAPLANDPRLRSARGSDGVARPGERTIIAIAQWLTLSCHMRAYWRVGGTPCFLHCWFVDGVKTSEAVTGVGDGRDAQRGPDRANLVVVGGIPWRVKTTSSM